uniref:Uncharacterized protein n=1 Tax=Knipowitschia caucasica TaxID=637954 RepID=A0AAV2MAT7_KNICA
MGRTPLTSPNRDMIGHVDRVSEPITATADDVITSVATSWTEGAWFVWKHRLMLRHPWKNSHGNSAIC